MSSSRSKPYRVYRQRRARADGSIQWGEDGGGPPRRAGGARRVARIARRVLFVLIVLACAWGAVAFLSFRSAVAERNDEVPAKVRAELAPTNGPAIATSRTVLLVGADTSSFRAQQGGENGLADTLILLRVDVKSRSWSMLSIPRDLYVAIPGVTDRSKINQAYAIGGLPLAIRTVRQLTGEDVHHVVQIDFDGFKEVIDAVGGITIDNPKTVDARCGECRFDGRKWFFPKGELELDGRDALAYARIRKTTDIKESDLTRGARQQAVIDAILAKVVSTESMLHPRKVPRAVVQPVLTDVSAADMVAFGFGKAWASDEHTLRCRLGGEAEQVDGEDVLIPDEANRATVRMWAGEQSPLAPDTATNQFAPGCVRGV